MRHIVIALLFCAAFITAASAEKPAAPAAGQTIEEFEKANTAEITATPGNKMGYTSTNARSSRRRSPAPQSFISDLALALTTAMRRSSS